MAFRARPLDFTALATEGIASAAVGGGQQLAYRQNRNIGMLSTAAAIGGGIALKMFGGPGLMDQLGNAAFMSGSAVAGYKLAEQVFPANGTAAFRAPAYRPQVAGQRNARPASRPAVSAGQRALPAGRPAYNRTGNATPQVSLGGVNPATGERMFFSRV